MLQRDIVHSMHFYRVHSKEKAIGAWKYLRLSNQPIATIKECYPYISLDFWKYTLAYYRMVVSPALTHLTSIFKEP